MEHFAPGGSQAPSTDKLHYLLSECELITDILFHDLQETIDQGTNNERMRVCNILQEINSGRYPYEMIRQVTRYS